MPVPQRVNDPEPNPLTSPLDWTLWLMIKNQTDRRIAKSEYLYRESKRTAVVTERLEATR